MSVKRVAVDYAYGLGDALIPLAPLPIIAERDPATNDYAQLGTTWVNRADSSVWILASVTNNSANWTTSPASGIGAFTSIAVNPGNVNLVAGNLTLGAGNISLTAGNLNVGGDLTVGGTISFSGDIDFTSPNLIDVISTLDAAPSILLEADGGTSEQVQLHSNQGTSASSILLVSDAGGITFDAALATANAFVFTSTSGGLNVDVGHQISLTTTRSAADSIEIVSSAGGIDITAAGAAAGEDIDISAVGSSVNISASESVADAVVITASGAAGGVQINAGTGGIAIGASATATPIGVGDIAPTASRTITVGGGTVVTAAVTDLVDIAPDGATTNANSIKRTDINSGNVTTGQSIVNINTGTAASGTSTVNIATGTGGGTKVVNIGNADGLTTVNIRGISALNSSVNANIAINGGTSTGSIALGNALAGAVTVDTAAGISLDAATASNFTVTGAGQDLTLASAGGSVSILATEDAASAVLITTNGGTSETLVLNAAQGTAANSINLVSDAGGITLTSNLATADGINLNAIAGGVDIDGALQVNIASAQAAAANSVRIVASAADGGIDIDSGTSGMTLDSTGAISIDAATASNFSAAAGDLTLAAATNSVVISAAEAVIDAVQLTASSGAVQVTGGALAATTGLNIVQGAASALVQVGAGAPSHNAPKGSLYLRTDGSGVNNRAYIAVDAAGTWTAIVTVA